MRSEEVCVPRSQSLQVPLLTLLKHPEETKYVKRCRNAFTYLFSIHYFFPLRYLLFVSHEMMNNKSLNLTKKKKRSRTQLYLFGHECRYTNCKSTSPGMVHSLRINISVGRHVTFTPSDNSNFQVATFLLYDSGLCPLRACARRDDAEYFFK